MAIIKLNNRAVKDATAVGSTTQLGNLVFISKQTASSSSSVSFTSGIDSTYKEYIFYFNNIHPATNGAKFSFNLSTDGGSNYNVTKTTSLFDVAHAEADNDARISYDTSGDLAQSTAYQQFGNNLGIGTGNDMSLSGNLYLFSPSDTTFVKHFISRTQMYGHVDYSFEVYIGGYANTTSAIDAIDFKMNSGNIDSGEITLFGVA